MKQTFKTRCLSLTLTTLLLGVAGSIALAQPPGGPEGDGPPPMPGRGPGGPGGFGGPGGPGRPPFGGPPRQMTLANAPLPVLEEGLHLTASQKTKIAALQQGWETQRRKTMPRPDAQADGPPDPETMQANREKVQKQERAISSKIEETLNSEQKQQVPTLFKTLNTLRAAGIPLPLFHDLNLTAEQKQSLAKLAPSAPQGGPGPDGRGGPGGGRFGGPGMGPQSQVHSKVMALLTEEQRQTVTSYLQAHPRPERGGEFGPPRGQGRRGGGRPQGGPGQDGPPPPPDGNGPPPQDGQGPPEDSAGPPPPPPGGDGMR